MYVKIRAMLNIFTLLLPLFCVIAIGYVLARSGVAKKSWIKPFSQFNYYVAFPALIFQSISHTQISLERDGLIVLLQIIFGAALILIPYGIARWRKLSVDLRNAWAICLYFSNSGYIGIPALLLVFGEQAAGEGAIIVGVMILVTFTIGLAILEQSKHQRLRLGALTINIVKNVLLWSAVLGVIAAVVQVELPVAVTTLISYVAAAAVPTILIDLGIFLALNHPTRQTFRSAGWLAFVKMVAIPGVFTLVYWLLPNNDWLMTTYVQASMPIALTAFAFTEIYPVNKAVTSNAIALSTLLSLVTLPVVMWLASVL